MVVPVLVFVTSPLADIFLSHAECRRLTQNGAALLRSQLAAAPSVTHRMAHTQAIARVFCVSLRSPREE